ncbi:hypothetical protein CFBP3846_P500003 (plasmid) [Pseudomonas syringae pv. avii]|uniref:Transposase n=1 Tax=Pseudomonas syringae pv. avii TaxID=663959 RepID=A0ABY1UG62_PSESX|nr:hypothetical protein CFBP3846_P500003 [Pseudomonas syringae pv. avii]
MHGYIPYKPLFAAFKGFRLLKLYSHQVLENWWLCVAFGADLVPCKRRSTPKLYLAQLAKAFLNGDRFGHVREQRNIKRATPGRPCVKTRFLATFRP